MNLMEKLGLERVVRFRIYIDGKGAVTAAALMGAALFCRILYYFGFGYFADCGAFSLITGLILPVLFFGASAVLLKGVRLTNVRVYGILAAVYCGLMILWSFDPGRIFYSLLAIVWYLAAMAAVIGTAEGYVSNRLVMQLAFLLPVLYRFFLFDLADYVTKLKLVEFLTELSNLCGLLAWSSFARCLMPERIRKMQNA